MSRFLHSCVCGSWEISWDGYLFFDADGFGEGAGDRGVGGMLGGGGGGGGGVLNK